MACAICATRRPRRFCSGVHGDICTTCCGEEREVSITCPLDCEYLQEARKHEKPAVDGREQFPNRDIRVNEESLGANEVLLAQMAGALVRSALDTEGVVDFDVRDALDALIRTYRTLSTGIYYETRPDNHLAVGLYAALQETIEQFRKEESDQTGIHKTRDTAILVLLVFLQHLELDTNNGRKRGRAFLNTLLEFYTEASGAAPPSPSLLILP
jgi:hypothetical protein